MFLSWWTDISAVQQYSFVIAIAATFIMLIFIVLMLIGMDGAESFDGDVDLDMDFDVDIDDLDDFVDGYNNDSITSVSGLKILTIRGVLAFFSIGGWTVYGIGDSLPLWATLLIGVVAGAVAAVLLAYAMKSAMKLERSGNIDYKTAIGKTAIVYIRVPKKNAGFGKVMLTHQGRMIEVNAITKEEKDLLTKQEVKIIGLHDSTTLVVKKIEEE